MQSVAWCYKYEVHPWSLSHMLLNFMKSSFVGIYLFFILFKKVIKIYLSQTQDMPESKISMDWENARVLIHFINFVGGFYVPATILCVTEWRRMSIWNFVLFSLTPCHTSGLSHMYSFCRTNAILFPPFLLHCCFYQSLVIFILMAYHVSWYTSFSGLWIHLGELLCHFRRASVHPCVAPLNSHTFIYSKGDRPHKLLARIHALCGKSPELDLYLMTPYPVSQFSRHQ